MAMFQHPLFRHERLRRIYPLRVLCNRGALWGALAGSFIGLGFTMSALPGTLEGTGSITFLLCLASGAVFGGMLRDIMKEAVRGEVKGSLRLAERYVGYGQGVEVELLEYRQLRNKHHYISDKYKKFCGFSSVRAFRGDNGRPLLMSEAELHTSEVIHGGA